MSLPHRNPKTPSGALYEPIEPICMNCKHWVDKAWSDSDNGHGKCTNDQTAKQVSILSEAVMAKYFVAGKDDHEKQQNAEVIAASMRFHSKFGCIHFEPIEP